MQEKTMSNTNCSLIFGADPLPAFASMQNASAVQVHFIGQALSVSSPTQCLPLQLQTCRQNGSQTDIGCRFNLQNLVLL